MTIIKPLVANIKKTAMAVVTLETVIMSLFSSKLSTHRCWLAEYVDNVILFQLCLLVIQRLALTISPLKVHLLMTRKHVMKAIGVTVIASLIVDTLFATYSASPCM
jgi:hypothetical protein